MSQSAEVPKAPEDSELRNIIDKLAQFVAKNGPEFENMTKQKQKDNARFGFLYGGEYCHYYMYRVSIEQALARKRQQTEQNQQQQQNVAETKVQMLQTQISESERNLKAQYDVLMKQQEGEINEAVRAALERQIFQVAQELRLNIQELGCILDGLAYPYAQEGQESAVNWIFAHYSTPKHGELLVRYLLERIKDPREYFQRKLSILYIVTSLIQRSIMEQNDHMAGLLDRFAPIMSSYAMKLHCQQDERARKDLDQLIRSWLQPRLLGEVAEWRCSNFEETIGQYQSELRSEYGDIVAEVTQRIQSHYRQYELQHHEYARHIQQQIASEQYQKQQQPTAMMTSQMQQQHPQTDNPPGQPQQQTAPTAQQPQPRRSRFDDVGAGGASVQPPPPPTVINPLAQAPPGVSPWQQPPPLIAAAITNRPPPAAGGPPVGSYPRPPPHMPPSLAHFPPPSSQQQHAWPPAPGTMPSQGPWMSAPPASSSGLLPSPAAFGPALPPPGVCTNVNVSQPPPKPAIPAPSAIDEQSLIPKVAYYDLPAGLMAPLIKLEDHYYEPVQPEDLRLPAPMPPSERLLAAVEAFYAPPNHENPRDSDGWERLGLYEYYKEKGKAINRASAKNKKHLVDDNKEDSPNHGERRKTRK